MKIDPRTVDLAKRIVSGEVSRPKFDNAWGLARRLAETVIALHDELIRTQIERDAFDLLPEAKGSQS